MLKTKVLTTVCKYLGMYVVDTSLPSTNMTLSHYHLSQVLIAEDVRGEEGGRWAERFARATRRFWRGPLEP